MENKKVIIIAEAGVNHNGNFELAKKMIAEAKKAGADYVKFQTAVPELVISTIAPKAEYQKENTGNDENQLEMCKAIHLPLSAYSQLKAICDKEGIGFLSTPFDLVSIDVLEELDMDFYKIPSGEITNLPYLRKIATKGKSVIISTGMSEISEIAEAIKVLEEGGISRDRIILLHCNTEYPTPYKDVNLNAMKHLHDVFGVIVGYSDHTKGIEVPVAAVAMGAQFIEKHFTLDRNMEGPDHKASLEPAQLKEMIDSIRNVEDAIGEYTKHATESETPNKVIARKSIVAAKDIRQGELFSDSNITTKRPGNGISPMLWDKVIGTAAKRDFKYDELIEL